MISLDWLDWLDWLDRIGIDKSINLLMISVIVDPT